MSLFTEASLVLVPSGIKNQKIYSVKPTDGSGDLTFSRASSATRVNSSGLVEKVRENIALYSEAQDSWTDQFQTSVTANAAANPINGAVTADKVIPSATTDDHYRGLSMGSIVGEFTSSIYVKADGYSIIDYGVFNSTASNYPVRAVFDLSTQTITHINGSISSITSVGSGWYRIRVTASVASTSTMGIYHRVRSTGTSGAYAGDGTSGMLLWGCQLENGVMTDYIGPTTSSAVSVGPVSGLPRLDYSGGASCPSLLLEPQRTNVYLNSENFATSDGISGSTIISNVETSPDGYLNADKIQGDGSATAFQVFNNITIAASTIYTFSVFAKAGNTNFVQLSCTNMDTDTNAVFDLSLGTITLTGASSNPIITNYGNGWYRCSIQMVAQTTDLSGRFRIYVPADGIGSGWPSAASTNGKNILLYGRQLEAGAYATSYINTLNSAVTRGSDSASKTGISSLIGQTEGTFFAEVDFDSSVDTEGYIVRIDESSFDDTIFVARGGDKILSGVLRSGGSTIAQLQKTAFNGVNKLAFAYKSGSFALYVNGTQVATSAATYTNGITYDDIRIGGFNATTANMCGGVKQTLLFKTRLSNADLATLTTI